jgi:hypothetical protein
MSRQSEKELRLRDAMRDLVQDPRFQVWMEALRELRESAVGYMIDHTTVKDQRESLAAVGEVRCYDTIWQVYEAHREPVANQVVGEQEG